MDRDEMIKISLLVSKEAKAMIDKMSDDELRAFVSSDAPNAEKKRYAQFGLDRRLEKEGKEKDQNRSTIEALRHRENLDVASESNQIARKANRVSKIALAISILSAIGTIIVGILQIKASALP